MLKKRIGIIGATGSIGVQAADVVMRNKDAFEVVFVSAYSNGAKLHDIAAMLGAQHELLMSEDDADSRFDKLLESERIDLVLHAASGVDGLRGAYKLAENGIDIALANKECIVTAGAIIIDTAEKNDSKIIPVDSEHSAVFQCLKGERKQSVRKITLTASGGPFRKRPHDAMALVSLDEALRHPKWSMGKKITVDSATMMNKGLELIEAHYLFGVPAEMLDVVIHPESIVHSLVTFSDGSTLAQLGCADMRIPISFALGYPERIMSGAPALDLAEVGKLTFEKPDLSRFRCLKLATDALISGSNAAMTVLNAANESAVKAFLENRILFTDIACIVETALETSSLKDAHTIDEAYENNIKAREAAERIITTILK